MRTTIALDDDLIRTAQEFTGVEEKTALIREAPPWQTVIIADTSVWFDHFRSGSGSDLQSALNRGEIMIHPWIIAELALGSLRDRTRTLAMLDLLPQVGVATMSEARHLIEARRLYNLGVGLTGAHLLASVFLHPPILLWTRDRQLRRVAEGFGIHAKLP